MVIKTEIDSRNNNICRIPYLDYINLTVLITYVTVTTVVRVFPMDVIVKDPLKQFALRISNVV